MVQQSKKEELLVSWRALAGQDKKEGWNIIPVTTEIQCRILAGCHYPGNEEAILFGFSSIKIPPADQLPQGHGFLVSKVDPCETLGRSNTWVVLSRQHSGSLDLFVTMADDIILTLTGLKHINDKELFHVFLGRIRAWQSFMYHGQNAFLSSEKEIGLFGELEFLQELLLSGLPAKIVIDSWEGPLDGLHDFKIGIGAIEVKTTISPTGFSARISSLEQLDDSLIQPLFLVGIRLTLNTSGITLPEKIGILRRILNQTPEALAMFNSALINIGFFEDLSDPYTRRFLLSERKIMRISSQFPCLTRANVRIEIKKAKYELDLDMVNDCAVDFNETLSQLKVM